MPPKRPPRPKTRDDFEIAIICALTLEADAVIALFDHHWDEDNGPSFGRARGDPNAYSTGTIGHHNVVLAHLPGMGKVAAGNIAAFCRMSFPNINLALVVGICGGAPLYDKGQILLGDVIISTGVVQYDLGRRFTDQFEMKDTLSESLGRPNLEIRNLFSKLTTARQIDRLQTSSGNYLDLLCQDPKRPVNYPGRAKDILFPVDYRHKHQNPSVCTTCASCQSDTDPVCQEATKAGCDELGCDLKQRLPRHAEEVDKPCPVVHFGNFASADTVMKSGRDRDQLTLIKKAIGFEMESVGVWEVFPCIVIKSVCDYADSHKTKDWQGYAAASAAAYTKALLEYWDSTSKDPQAEAEAKQLQECFLESLRFPEMNERRNNIASKTPSTFQWIFDDLSEDPEDYEDFDDGDEYYEYDVSREPSYRAYGGTSDEDSSDADDEMPDEIDAEGSDRDPGQTDEEYHNKDVEETTDTSSTHDTSTSNGTSNDYNEEGLIPRRRERDWDSFEDWLVSGQKIYWISGKPGSGKSTLMRFLLSDSRTLKSLERWQFGTVILSHFFWKPGSAMQRSYKGFLCSIVYQLLTKDSNSFDLFCDIIAPTHRASPSDWDQRELCKVLYGYRQQSSQPVCVFIDALDEAAPGQDTLDLLQFIGSFVSPVIKICVSSRPEHFFQLHLQEYPQLKMHTLISDDIVEHTMHAIRKWTIRKPRDLNIAKLADQVAESAEGVFLWAVLVTRSLIRGINYGESQDMIQQRLNSMPSDLMDLYRDILLRSAEDRPIYQKHVSMVLNLVLLTFPLSRPGLTVFECMMVMEAQLLEKYVVNGDHIPLEDLQAKTKIMRRLVDVGCNGILQIDDNGPVPSGILSFTHRAAHEFLLDTEEGRSLWKDCEISKKELWTRRLKSMLARSRFCITIGQSANRTTIGTLLAWLRNCQKDYRLPPELVVPFLKIMQMNRGFLNLQKDDYEVAPRCHDGKFLVHTAMAGFLQFVVSDLENLEQSTAHETMYCLFYRACAVLMLPTEIALNLETIRYMLNSGYSPNWNIHTSKGNRMIGSPWIRYLVTALHSIFWDRNFEGLDEHVPELRPSVLENIQMFLEAGASMASKFPVAFQCSLRYQTRSYFNLPEVHAAGPSTLRQKRDDAILIEMNASAVVDIIVQWIHLKFGDAIQLNPTGSRPHMKALAFRQGGDDTLFVVESELASDLLTEAVSVTFFGVATTTHAAWEPADTARKRCNGILRKLKTHCRPTNGPYFWKGFKL